MEIEIIPTEKGKVVLKTFMLYPFPKTLDSLAWNEAIDEAIHFLDEHKLDIKDEFKRADKI